MKKTLKKSLIILIMTLAALILWNGKASAASISAPSSVKEGDTITVTVNYGEKVKSAQMVFSYNSSNLEYKGASGTYNPATKKYAAFSMDGTDSLSVATFTFIAKKAGSVSFSFESLKVQSTTKGKFEPKPSSGTAIVTVNAKTTPKPDTKPNTNTDTGNTTKPSTDKKPTFSGSSQKVYAKETVSIRDSWSTSGKLLGTLQKGASITRTGIGSNGWDRVTYNGRTAYISHTYLTTTKPKDDKDEEKDKNNTTNEVSNNTTNNEIANNTVNNETTNNQTNDVTNSETNEATNTQTQGNIEKDDKKGFSVNTIEIIIISVIIIAIIVIIINEILAKKREEKRREARKRDEKRVKGSRR